MLTFRWQQLWRQHRCHHSWEWTVEETVLGDDKMDGERTRRQEGGQAREPVGDNSRMFLWTCRKTATILCLLTWSGSSLQGMSREPLDRDRPRPWRQARTQTAPLGTADETISSAS